MKLLLLLLLCKSAFAISSIPSGDVNQHDGNGVAITSTSSGGHTYQDLNILGLSSLKGVDGHTIYNGSGAPASNVGSDGDFYIDTTAHAIYGPKTSGAWGSSTNLVGPTGATGSTGATGAAGSNGTNGTNGTVQTPDLGVTIIENFMSTSGVGNNGWSAASGGSGSGTGVETTPIVSTTHQGVVGCYTGSTTTGRCSMILAQQTLISAGVITVESMIDIPTLSVVGDEYIFRSGLVDTGSAAPSAGVWFSYDRLNLGTTWQCNSAHATSVSTTNSTVTVTTGWHKLKIVVNAAGTSADFYIDGVNKCTMTNNFPTSSDLLGIYPNGIFKSAGTTNTSTKIDYMYYNEVFTTPL